MYVHNLPFVELRHPALRMCFQQLKVFPYESVNLEPHLLETSEKLPCKDGIKHSNVRLVKQRLGRNLLTRAPITLVSTGHYWIKFNGLNH